MKPLSSMEGKIKTTGVICFLRVDKKGIMGYYASEKLNPTDSVM